jgi:nucleotide-binding universal stress UspA family protein
MCRSLKVCSEDSLEMIKKILFPVDFSPACAAMAGYVRSVAKVFGAGVTLLYVVNLVSRNGFEIYVRPEPEIEEENRALAQDKLNSFLHTEFPASESNRLLAFGDPADETTRIANASSCDLIVMPTHAGRFRRMLLGSTTAKVLVDAGCPVLTTQHAETISPKPLDARSWLCAISPDEDPRRVLSAASEAAQVTGARLSVLHIIQASSVGISRELTPDDERTLPEARTVRGRAEQLQLEIGSSAPVHIAAGPSVEETLIEAVRRAAPDLLIIGRNGQHDLAYQIVRDSPVSVLSL